MFTNRRPYYGLKMSTTDFFREPVRFLKESNTQESMMEKPYLEDEYPKMHLSLPDFKFKPKEIPSIFGPIADGDPFPGLAMIDFGDAKCHWGIARTSACVEGRVTITLFADYLWSAEFEFNIIASGDTRNIAIERLPDTEAGAWDEQDYLLTFPENYNGTISICGSASTHTLISQTFETVVAGQPVGIYMVHGALMPIERGQSKPATLLSSSYGLKGDSCGCIEISSSCATCDSGSIAYTSQQMVVDETQGLSVVDPVEGCTYYWNIALGGGSLLSSTGTSVDYTAPSSNANCLLNPTITLSTGGSVRDSLSLAVNASPDTRIGYDYSNISIFSTGFDECTDTTGTCNGCYVSRIKRSHYTYLNCDGSTDDSGFQCGDPTTITFWQCTYCADGEDCPGSCAGQCEYPEDSVIINNCINTRGGADNRTEAQLEAGCCPAQLL